MELRGEIAQLKGELSLQCKRLARHAENEVSRITHRHEKELADWRREKRKLMESNAAISAEAYEAAQRARRCDAKMEELKKRAATTKKDAAQLAKDAQQLATEAHKAAQVARDQLILEEQAVVEAEKAKTDAEWTAKLAELRAERARKRVDILREKLDEIGATSSAPRSVDELMQLSANAQRQAACRERQHLKAFFYRVLGV